MAAKQKKAESPISKLIADSESVGAAFCATVTIVGELVFTVEPANTADVLSWAKVLKGPQRSVTHPKTKTTKPLYFTLVPPF